jgi:hypothetical protein
MLTMTADTDNTKLLDLLVLQQPTSYIVLHIISPLTIEYKITIIISCHSK